MYLQLPCGCLSIVLAYNDPSSSGKQKCTNAALSTIGRLKMSNYKAEVDRRREGVAKGKAHFYERGKTQGFDIGTASLITYRVF